MTVRKPAELIRFISNIPVMSNGVVPLNLLEEQKLFESELYTPTFILTTPARMALEDIENGKIEVTNEYLDPNTIVSKAVNSDLSLYAPSMYLLLRMIVLESFAILYAIEQSTEGLRYLSPQDFLMIKENISYLADYFGTESKYHHMIEGLRSLHISLGYMQNQIDVILTDKGLVSYG